MKMVWRKGKRGQLSELEGGEIWVGKEGGVRRRVENCMGEGKLLNKKGEGKVGQLS